MKYFLIKIEERNGEQEYTTPYLIETDSEDINQFVEDIAKTWYGEGEASAEWDEDDQCYYFFGGQIAVSVDRVTELLKEHYDILSKYI